MTNRRFVTLGFCAITCASLLVGCFGGNKKKQHNTAADTTATDAKNERHDPFETMADPPLNANTRFAAGQLAESEGTPQKAIAQDREALKLDPRHQQTLFRLGAIYTDEKKFDEAIKLWQRYVEATDRSPAAYNNLALCYEKAERFNEAEKTYRAGIDRDANDSTCRVNYGLMLARQGRTDEAIAQFETVLSPAEVHYNLGAVCEQQGKKDQAKAYYQKALELDPKLHDAQARLAALK